MRRSLAAMLAVPMLVASGCSGDPPPLEGGTELELPTHPDWDEGPEALVGGEAEFDEASGCVYLVTPDYRVLAVWPRGTRATRDPFRIVLGDGREIREGDKVVGSGGEYGFEIEAMTHCVSDDVGASMLNWDDDIVIRPSRN